MQEVIKKNKGWVETKGAQWDVSFLKPSYEDDKLREYIQQKGKIVNRFPGANDLSHKDQFARQMQIC